MNVNSHLFSLLVFFLFFACSTMENEGQKTSDETENMSDIKKKNESVESLVSVENSDSQDSYASLNLFTIDQTAFLKNEFKGGQLRIIVGQKDLTEDVTISVGPSLDSTSEEFELFRYIPYGTACIHEGNNLITLSADFVEENTINKKFTWNFDFDCKFAGPDVLVVPKIEGDSISLLVGERCQGEDSLSSDGKTLKNYFLCQGSAVSFNGSLTDL